MSFKMEAAGFVGFFVLVIFGPLMMFTRRLERTKRKGSAEYGLLANQYLALFEAKWIRSGNSETSGMLGSADIQSLADIGNACTMVRQMRLVPFSTVDVTRLAATTAAPLVPLLLTAFSVADLLKLLVKVVFK
jgi:hypothetical protein